MSVLIQPDPKNIVQVYRMATDEIDDVNDLEQVIKASKKVISFCDDSGLCRVDDSVKRNQLLLWSYNSLAKAYVDKNAEGSGYKFSKRNFQLALGYFSRALELARDANDKIGILRQVAEIYKLTGNEKAYFEIKEDEISLLPSSERREAYVNLAAETSDTGVRVELMEKALNFVADEEVSFLVKCQNTLEICDYLEEVYKNRKDKANFERILNLLNSTAVLMVDALNERINKKNEREKNMGYYTKILDVETRYLEGNEPLKRNILTQLARFLENGEEIRVNGMVFNKDNIPQMLH